jgi:predicted MFS family arabinose efflux permease
MNFQHIKPYFTVLKNTNFTKLWLSQVCSQLTNYLLSFAILIRVFSITGSSTSVALVILSFGLATVFFGFLAGVYSDRFDRKWLLTITNFLQAITILLYVIVDRNIFNIAIITFIYSSLNQFYLPSEAPSIPSLVSKSELLIANSYFSFTGSASLIIGFALAGPLVLQFGQSAPFIVGTVLLMLATVATISLPPLRPKHVELVPHTIKNLWSEFLTGVKHFWESKALHLPLKSLIAVQIVNGMLITIAPQFVGEVLGIELEKAALLLIAPLGLGILVGALMLGYENNYLSKLSLIRIGFLGMAVMIMLLSLTGQFEHKLIYYSIVAALVGIFNSHIFAPSHSILQLHAFEHIRGRVYGALYVMLQIAATLPTIVVGLLADKYTSALVLQGISLLLLMFGLNLIIKKQLLDKVLD